MKTLFDEVFFMLSCNSCEIFKNTFLQNTYKRPLSEFLVQMFSHSNWILRHTEYLSVFSPNVEKYGPVKPRILTPFAQCMSITLSRYYNKNINWEFWKHFCLLRKFSKPPSWTTSENLRNLQGKYLWRKSTVLKPFWFYHKIYYDSMNSGLFSI